MTISAQFEDKVAVKTKLSIMLVEDSEDDYLITYWLLNQIYEEAELTIDWKKTYEGALTAAQMYKYDVYLIDVNLNGGNGLDLAKKLNPTSENTPPIIFLTGVDDIDLELNAIRLGAADCLFKNQLTAPLLERAINYSIVRKQTEKELRLNENRYRAILETATDGIITIDDKGIITSCNRSAESLFGYLNDEMLGHNVSQLMLADVGEKHNHYLRQYLVTKETRMIGSGREEVGVRKDGSTFPMFLSIADIGISGAHRFSGIVRDLTLEKKAKKDIENQNLILEKTVVERTLAIEEEKEKAINADKAKTEFLANISHEIRTPLYGILSFANMGVDRVTNVPSQKSKEYFKHILDSGDRLLRLLNDLLDLSKLESNKNKMKFIDEDIDVITRQCFQSEKARLHEKDIHWEINKASSVGKVQCNNDGVRQVISNLLSNAIRFSPVGGKINVMLDFMSKTLDDEPNVLRFSIVDEGVGIPEKETKVIFDKFIQSTKTNTGAGGTGLGLSICKEIIKIHKGKIWAENGMIKGESKGAVFSFDIPIKHLL